MQEVYVKLACVLMYHMLSWLFQSWEIKTEWKLHSLEWKSRLLELKKKILSERPFQRFITIIFILIWFKSEL